MKTKSRSRFGWLIFAVVLLANPNHHVIDALPDTFAWFLLAYLFTEEADRLPSFAEARKYFIRLGWLNLVKLPALAIVASTSSTYGHGDTVALVALVFAIGDLLLGIPAVFTLFDALFYLGERTDASALLSDDAPRNATVAWIAAKPILALLPQLALLTQKDIEKSLALAKWYPVFAAVALVGGAALGVYWFLRMYRYLRRIHDRGQFSPAVRALSDELGDYADRRKRRLTDTAFLLFEIGVFFLFPFPLEDLAGMSLLPDWAFALLAVLAFGKLANVHPAAKKIYFPAILFGAVSFAVSLLLAYFNQHFGYGQLMFSREAMRIYHAYEGGSALEFLCYTLLLLSLFLFFRRYIPETTGTSPDSPDYLRSDRLFHQQMQRKNRVWFLFGEAVGAAKLFNVLQQGAVSVIETGTPDPAGGVIYAPQWEWFGVVIGVLAIVFLFDTVSVLSSYREEERL